MTNDQYGNYQTPSSRPPEPPYRTEMNDATTPYDTPASTQPPTQGAQPTVGLQPDFSGFDTPGNTAQMGGVNSSDPSNAYGNGPVHSYAATAAPAVAKKSSGAGKTFIAGFLGALLACALAFGGYTLITGGKTSPTAAQTTIGATDSSVINAVEEGHTIAEAVAAKALPSVVAVYNYQQATGGYGYGYGYGAGFNTTANDDTMEATGMGSGVVISDDGYIITNYHVVEGADKITVKVGDDEREATYVGGDGSSDIAVVKVENTDGLEAADIGDSDELVIGEWVMTVGAPLGLEQSVATGVVSATNRSTIMSDSESDLYSLYYGNSTPSYTYYPNMIQTDAVINPGNSGGALVDSDGKLIGINTMISSYSGDYAGVGFAIPVNYAISIANDIIEGKEPTHAMLGVSISSVTASNAKRYGLSVTSGAYVSSISEGTGAAESDLQVGDIITAVDGKQVTTTTDVTLDVRAHNPGDTVTVTVNRNGETIDIPVVLGSDENMTTPSSSESQQYDGYGNGQGQGHGIGGGNGYGYGGGTTQDQLEELLKMLGM